MRMPLRVAGAGPAAAARTDSACSAPLIGSPRGTPIAAGPAWQPPSVLHHSTAKTSPAAPALAPS